MYDGIFDDVEHVKKVLASHGHESVDETLVFELLEDLKVTDRVVKVLLGNRLRRNLHYLDISGSTHGSFALKDAVQLPRVPDSFYSSTTIEDSCSSDDLEILEQNTVDHASRVQSINAAIDLTINNNRSILDKANYKDIENKMEELVARSAKPSIDPIIETLNVVQKMEVKDESCGNEKFRDNIESKADDTDGNDSLTDSESEMDDYYREDYMPDTESEESQGFEESDGKVSLPPSLILGVSTNFETQGNLEPAENRMEEMLEENNNDPNNNLEDNEVLEQNILGASAIVNDLNTNKEPVNHRCSSPKPGCSKDSYYADNDFCSMEESDNYDLDSGAASNTNQSFTVGTRPNIANIFEEEDFIDENSARISETKIEEDISMIQKILPNYSRVNILSKVMENPEASNRVEIALWDLLSDEKPTPILPIKRKQNEDNCPSSIKKYVPDESDCLKKNTEHMICKELMVTESMAPGMKNNIIKPSKLKVSDSRVGILRPPKLMVSIPQPFINSGKMCRSKSIVRLKPSKLEHVVSSNTEKSTVASYESLNTTETGAIRKRPKQSSTALIPTKLENRPKESIQFGDKKPAALSEPKMTERTEAPQRADKVSNYHLWMPSTIAKEQKDTMKSDHHNTGTIPKKLVLNETPVEKQLKQPKGLKESNIETAVAVAKAPVQVEPLGGPQKIKIFYKYGTYHAEPGSSINSQQALDQNLAMPNDLGDSEDRLRVHSPVIQANELINEFPIPSGGAAVVAAHNPSGRVGNKDRPGNREFARRMNEFTTESIRSLDELQFQSRKLLQTILNNTAAPNLKKKKTILPLAEDFNLIFHEPASMNAMAPQGLEEIKPLRIERPEVTPPKELFNPLINMFPDVDPNYITKLCISAKLKNQSLESVVEILLIYGRHHPRVINPEPEPQEINPDAQYENLQGIFPDAHPEYLRGIAEQYYNDPEAMKNFVQTKLENHEYPTMADYLKKIKITEQIKQYTVDFSPEQFLAIFPDPFAYFEDPKRVNRYNVIAFEFLKCHFRGNKVNTILRAYRLQENPHHLTLAAKTLEMIGPDMKTRRSDKQFPIEDIPLLQEFAFIRHKAVIKNYIKTERLKEKQEFIRLKKNNELLECQCCYDGECMPSKCLTCSKGHIFCKSCIKTGSATRIGEGQMHFRCFVECEGEFTLPVLQKVLEPTMFSILLRKRQEEEVKAAGLEGLVSCPFCHFASIPPPEDKVFKCLNPECMKETCRLCKELNHVPLHCDEVVKGEEARHYLEEKMTEALVRKCYHCARPFFKDEGCNKMTCPCGAMTCYICGEAVKDYKHFNGQGSDRVDLCPLWSDNNVLNAQTVRVIAAAAEKEILKKNPHLKIDAEALMPTIPRASRGPHQDIANAHVLPVHTRRA